MIQNTSALQIFKDCTRIPPSCFTEEETGRDKPRDVSTVSSLGRERGPEPAHLGRGHGWWVHTECQPSLLLPRACLPEAAAQATRQDSHMEPADRTQK